MAFILAFVVPVAKDAPSFVKLKTERAEELLEELRADLLMDVNIQLSVVMSHPLVFAVRPTDIQKSRFVLSMERDFLVMLEDDELRAALAHELGHVWIFTNHPYLHTERLANSVGLRVVKRDSFEKLYSKLWVYEGASGIGMDQLLGSPFESQASAPAALTSGPP
jgi:hypothetical protein